MGKEQGFSVDIKKRRTRILVMTGAAALAALGAAAGLVGCGDNDEILPFDPPSPNLSCIDTLQYINDGFENEVFVVRGSYVVTSSPRDIPEKPIDLSIGILTDDKETFIELQEKGEAELVSWFIKAGIDHFKVVWVPMKTVEDSDGKKQFHEAEIPGINGGMVTGTTSCLITK